ncbi:MAG: hypothetical protein UY86_C0002G0110, partial [Candidatus Adlerbacteria bacterium GW2011_GWB1_54_7]
IQNALAGLDGNISPSPRQRRGRGQSFFKFRIVDRARIGLATSALQKRRSTTELPALCGPGGARIPDLVNANDALYQLSYGPARHENTLHHCRAAGNRTQSSRTRSARTTGILQPAIETAVQHLPQGRWLCRLCTLYDSNVRPHPCEGCALTN